MRFLPSSIALAFLLSVAAVPVADAWVGSSLKAAVTKYDIRAAIKAKKALPKKTVPASVELPAAAKGALLWGSPEATTTIVMFTDIECPFCRSFHEKTFPALKKEYLDTKKVRFAIRQFPLAFHPNASNAAKAVVCARAQGDALARALYEKLVASKLTLAAIGTAAEGASLDSGALSDCIASESAKTTVDADIAIGKAAKVSGTPAFLIIGPTGTTKTVQGAYPLETFAAAIADVQKK